MSKKTSLIGFFLASTLFFDSGKILSQDFLIPDSSYITSHGGYQEKLRYVFRYGYIKEAILQVMVTSTNAPEYVVGVRNDNNEYKVFSLASKIYISDYERIEIYEADAMNGGFNPAVDEKIYRELLKITPKNYREIKLDEANKAIDKILADRISKVWRSALLEVRRANSYSISLEGVKFLYSMNISGYGSVSGISVNPKVGTKMYALAGLVKALKDYSRGLVEIDEVENKLEECERYFNISNV